MLKVCFLGSFVVEANGSVIAADNWKSKKALILFKYLSSRPEKKVPKDSLIELLWEDGDPVCSTHNLHTTIYNLRRSIFPSAELRSSDPIIQYRNGLYWFAPVGGYSIDIQEFNRLRKRIGELKEVDPPVALDLAKKALNLYQGDFLEEDLYEDWTINTRDSLREKYFELALQTAQLCVKCHTDYKLAVQICREAITYDITREQLHQAIIRYLLAEGLYVDAVLQYNSCEKALADELGLTPSEDTYSLIRHIKNKDHMEIDNYLVDGISDKNAFSAILDFEQKQFERNGKPYTQLLISFAHRDYNLINQVLVMIKDSLRQGDLACQWADHQVAVLLPATGFRAANIVSQRLEKLLYQQIPKWKFNFQVIGVDQSDQTHKPVEKYG